MKTWKIKVTVIGILLFCVYVIIPFIITDRYKLIDIDNPIDFEFAEFVMKKQSIDKICDGEIERHSNERK